jgi:hypothetical protein
LYRAPEEELAMRRTVTGLLTLALLATSWSIAGASDQDKFNSLLGKYAVSGLGIPTKFDGKTPCYCLPGAVAPAYAAGYLVTYPVGQYTYVNCYVPLFNPDGSLMGTQYCNTWAPIGK